MTVAALSGTAAVAAPPASLSNARLGTSSAGGGIAAALRGLGGGPVWAAWAAPLVPGQGDVCCWNGRGGRVCHLERRSGGFSIANLQDHEERTPPPAPRLLYVFARLEAGEVTQVRALSETCAVDADGARVVWLEGAAADDSIELLRGLASRAPRRKGKDVGEEALTALALHAGPRADQVVVDLAGPGNPAEVREHAIFWLGEARGRAGYQALRRLAAAESDEEILEKVAFGLAQSPVPEAGGALAELASNHRSAEVRKHALFWVSQRGEPDAAGILLRAAAEDRDSEVREHAVFAISQLEEDGVDHLIRLLRDGPSNEVRKQALFWLGQSDDPRAMEFLEKVLLK
jgi:hypothetical protein